ncbi:MAG: hypothetical protein ACO3JL_19930, partial [Myxococcota bacterium]
DENDSEEGFELQLETAVARGGVHPMPSDLDDDFDLSDLDLDESEDLSDDIDLDRALDEIARFGELSSPTLPAPRKLPTDKDAAARPSKLPTRPAAPPLTSDPRLRPPRVTPSALRDAVADDLVDDADEATVLRPLGDAPSAPRREEPRAAPVFDEDNDRTIVGMPSPAPGLASSSRDADPPVPARPASPAPRPPSAPARTPTERRPLPGAIGTTQPAGGHAAATNGPATEAKRAADPMKALASLVGEGLSTGKTGAMVLDADAFAQLLGLAGADDLDAEADTLEAEAADLERRAAELRDKAALMRARVPDRAPARRLAERLAEQRAIAPSAGASGAPSGFARSSGPVVDAQRRPPLDMAPALQDAPDASERDVFAADGGGAETQVAQFDLSSLRRAEAVGSDAFAAPSVKGEAVPLTASDRPTTQAAIPVRSEDFESLSGFSDDFSGLGSATMEVEATAAVGLVATDARVRARLRQALGPAFPLVTEAESPAALLPHGAQRFAAVVLIQPRYEEGFAAALPKLAALRGAPRILLLSSDP